MKKTLLTTAALLLFAIANQAQNYFQQEVNYTISVRLNDTAHSLHARMEIEYINNSPDNLEFIYFHLWPNAYSNQQTALARQKSLPENSSMFKHPRARGFIDSLDFRTKGQKLEWEYDGEHKDICKVSLPKKLTPGSTITITTPFYVKLPPAYMSRMGHMQGTYMISQWFPKPAVYDHKGWHPMPYLDMGEFYSEYGSFDVSITVPANYRVAATGNLQNQKEKEWLNELAAKTGNIKTFPESNANPPSSDSLKTLRYTEENIHDFAWFADKRYHVLKDSITLDRTGHTVTTWSFFLNDEADLWIKSQEYIRDALKYYSQWYGDYPYENCTAVQGARFAAGGGMEYPTITVIGTSQNDLMLDIVIMHEVGHNWFYGMLGFNERDHGWMDEGINTFSEIRYMEKKYNAPEKLFEFLGNPKFARLLGIDHLSYQDVHKYMYLLQAQLKNDQPPALHSAEFTRENYSAMLYSKTGIAFWHLYHYLGEEKFNRIMQGFFKEWQYRHPYPEDLQAWFEKESGEDLSWLFQGYLETTKKADYQIRKIKNNKALIKNNGTLNYPVPLQGLTKKGDTLFTKWYTGIEQESWVELPDKPARIYKLPADQIPSDMNPKNNYYKTKCLFSKMEPLCIRPVNIVQDPDRSRLGILPAMAYNYYNGYMLGAYLHTPFFPPGKASLDLAPMYSFNNGNLAGMGRFYLQLYRGDSYLQKIQFRAGARQFSYGNSGGANWQRFDLGVDFRFRKVNHDKEGLIRAEYIRTKDAWQANRMVDYYRITGKHMLHDFFLSHKANTQLEFTEDFSKASFDLTIDKRFMKGYRMSVRVFAGIFLYNNENNALPINYQFGISGGTGLTDYTYDNIYLGRFESPTTSNYQQFFSQQFNVTNGGFAVFTPFSSSKGMLAVNLASAIPKINTHTLQVYANAAYLHEPVDFGYRMHDIYYEAGVKLDMGGFAEVFFPILMSEGMMNYTKSITENYWQRIRFTVRLEELKPREILPF